MRIWSKLFGKKKTQELAFNQPSFKDRLAKSRLRRNLYQYNVTITVKYNGKDLRKFNAIVYAFSKSEAVNKINKNMTLEVSGISRK
jgi:hypothetical protein